MSDWRDVDHIYCISQISVCMYAVAPREDPVEAAQEQDVAWGHAQGDPMHSEWQHLEARPFLGYAPFARAVRTRYHPCEHIFAMADDKKQKMEHGHGHSHDHADGSAPAKIVALGTVTLGGATFMIDRDGQVDAGVETEFGVEIVGAAATGGHEHGHGNSTGVAAVPSAAWLANPDGEKLCDPVSGEGHDKHWHFKVTPLMPVKRSSFVLRVGEEEATINFARGAAPCNEGILSVLKAAHAPEWRGYLELKLHGDAGDLELWLYGGFAMSNCLTALAGGKPTPFDVPKDTVIRLTFPSHPGKALEMRVRNADQNEDEQGTPNMRGGTHTNYFIFPGESGQDQEWLKGETSRYVAAVAFEADGKAYACDPFVLVPHEAL